MKVKGFEVPAEVEQLCLDRMHKHNGRFRKDDIASVAGAKLFFIGGDHCDDCDNCSLCDRIADRLIQRERLAKRIGISQYPWWESKLTTTK